MREKLGTGGRVLLSLMTLVSLVLLQAALLQAEAAEEGSALPPGSLTKMIPLSDGEVRQVPRYITEAGAVYQLNEAAITVEETGRGSSEGADVVTFQNNVEHLPDNDLERLEKQMVFEGISCELLSVVYDVEEEDGDGIPVSYTAACEYGGLKKYSTSYPNAWQMTVQYDLYTEPVEEASVMDWENYVHRVVPTETIEGEPGEEGFEASETEDDIQPGIRKIRIGPTPKSGQEEAGNGRIQNIALPLAAGTGITVPFIIWIAILTAPIYARREGKRYGYIGRIRIKKRGGVYTAYLTKRLFDRAELPAFRIKLPRRMWRKERVRVFYVHCPGGKRIPAATGKTVYFTVEGD